MRFFSLSSRLVGTLLLMPVARPAAELEAEPAAELVRPEALVEPVVGLVRAEETLVTPVVAAAKVGPTLAGNKTPTAAEVTTDARGGAWGAV